jgi:hypothetical protein
MYVMIQIWASDVTRPCTDRSGQKHRMHGYCQNASANRDHRCGYAGVVRVRLAVRH